MLLPAEAAAAVVPIQADWIISNKSGDRKIIIHSFLGLTR
jgi:hypothetical protein